jgi:hypothetical protein
VPHASASLVNKRVVYGWKIASVQSVLICVFVVVCQFISVLVNIPRASNQALSGNSRAK